MSNPRPSLTKTTSFNVPTYMTALNVLAIPESSDNYDDRNLNGHATEIREV